MLLNLMILYQLTSFRTDTLYPENLNHNLQIHEASVLVEHLFNYLRITKDNLTPELIEVIKYLPIFIEVDHALPISLLSGNTNWYLLPREEENSYEKSSIQAIWEDFLVHFGRYH